MSQLASKLDLVHTCGYVTLLNPHKEEVHEDELDGDPFVMAANSTTKVSFSSVTNTSETSPPEEFELTPETSDSSPKNGIKDDHCAQVLASELDSLDLDQVSDSKDMPTALEKTSLHLNVSSHNSSNAATVQKSEESLKEEEWLLLDLCYGLPLFDTQLNQQVCSRISKLGLFKDEK